MIKADRDMPHDTVPLTRRSASNPSALATIRDITAEAARLPAFSSHERVLKVSDARLGLTAFIAIHDTTLGPALGGCRVVVYPSRAAALTDALRLSKAMTYKAALAELGLGGGKTVVMAQPDARYPEAFYRSLGRAIESLGGRYITGEDSGTSVREMDWINRETPHVIGTSGRGGDPSLMTADGVLQGIRETVRHRLGVTNLAGVTVAVQGLGHVGAVLCERLAAAGARLIVSDVDGGRVDAVVRACGAEPVAPDYIHRVRADVFAPCALGGVLNARTIAELRCAAVAGSANNQLAGERDGLDLHARGILYAPDYVVNAGGLISAAVGLSGEDPNGPVAQARVEAIGRSLAQIFRRSRADGLPPEIVAGRIAEERLNAARQSGRTRMSPISI